MIPIVTTGPYAYDAVESERIYEKTEAITREVRDAHRAQPKPNARWSTVLKSKRKTFMSNIAVRDNNAARRRTLHARHVSRAHGGQHSHGPAYLHHHFTDVAQQRESNALGMWVFMVTEMMTFGALFFVYTLYRHLFEMQASRARYVSRPMAWVRICSITRLGFINTLVLLCSSLTVATAVHARA